MKEQNLPIKFILEIYEPGDDSCVAASYESDTPFMPIATGEYIHESSLNMATENVTLKVTSVEHILWEIENKHQAQKVCIRTERAEYPLP